MILSPAFREAMGLFAQDPLPPDTERRLRELERLKPPEERKMFADLWEAFFAARD